MVTCLLMTRCREDITPEMRIKDGEKVFRIEAVINVEGLGRELELATVEEAAS